MAIVDYTQTSGILDLDFLDLLNFDQVDITGNANLGGTLEIDLDPNSTPRVSPSTRFLKS